MSDFERLAGLIGLPAALIIMALLAGAKDIWCWSYQRRDAERREAEMRQDRDKWQALALKGTSLAADAVEIAKAKSS